MQYRDKVLRASYYTKLEEESKQGEAVMEKIPHKMLSICMQNVSLGDIVSWVLELINPNARLELPAPWNVLNRIDLSKFYLTIDLTEESLNFSYLLNLDLLGLFTVQRIGLTYNYGKETLCFTVVSKENVYTWDPLRESPPETIPNVKNFHLFYLGLGQHFGTEKIQQATCIQEAINAMEETFRPQQQEQLSYASEVNWIFGAHFSINDALDVSIVLNDPSLYGILIKVSGKSEPFQQFYGLMVELLYKKVTKDIGMFRATLQLPERIRTLELGAVSLTIGVMSLEIYTNGNFLLDLGFPHDRDFSRSFSVRYGIYSGQGGFYFGMLSGATCPNLPQPTTGVFRSALSIGIGLRLGINHGFDLGIVSARVSLELVGIFEGLFAIYDPGKERNKTCYYRVSAVAGIVGRVFLKVNLLIISLEASAQISAFAMLTLESCKAALVDLEVNVSLKAKVKILFFKIDVGYDFSKNFQFQIGSDEAAPWEVGRRCANAIIPLFESVKLYEQPVSLQMMIVPTFSMANGQMCVAFLPVMPQESYQQLVKLLCDWMLAGFSEYPGRELPDHLTPKRLQQEMDYERLDAFLSKNVQFYLCGIEDKDLADSNAVFPMPPPITLSFFDTGGKMEKFEISYWKERLVSDSYANRLQEYFERFDTMPSKALPPSRKNANRPLAEFVFLDYFHMILRALMRQASALYDKYEVLAKDFSCASAEERYGISLAEQLKDNLEVVLAPGKFIVPQKMIAAGNKQSILTIAEDTGILAQEILIQNLERLSLLQEKAEFTLGEWIYENSAKLPKQTAAALFFVRFGHFSEEKYYLKYMETLAGQIVEDVDWEFDGKNSRKLLLPDGTEWECLPGDTLERIARVYAIGQGALQKEASWEAYSAKFLERNKDSTENSLWIPAETVKISADASLGALLRRLFVQDWELPARRQELMSWPLFRQNVPILIQNFTFTLETPQNLGEVCKKWELSIEELASALKIADTPFAEGEDNRIVLYQISHMPKDQIQKELCRSQNISALFSAASRFLLQGLRILDPDSETAKTLGFYEVLKQQIPFSPEGEEWILEVEAGENGGWMQGSQTLSLTYEKIKPLLPDLCFDWRERFELERDPVIPLFLQMNGSYTIKENLLWATPSQNGQLSHTAALHLFSPELEEAFQQMSQPKLSAGRTSPSEIESSFYGILLSVHFYRKECTIVVEGMDSKERLLLREAILAANQESLEYWMFYKTRVENGRENTLVECKKEEHCLILRTNLSRETRMSFQKQRENHNNMLPCTATYGEMEFLQMLWECSTVGGGGYYLCMKDILEQANFDETDRGTCWLLIRDHGTLHSLVNCAVSGETILTSQGAPFFLRNMAKDEKQQVCAALPLGTYGLKLESIKPETEMEELFSIFGYQIEGKDYEKVRGRDSRPLLPVDSTKGVSYDITAPLGQMIDNKEENPYQVLGRQAKFKLYCRDVLGNEAPGELHYTITPEINDCMLGLHVWPGVIFSYELWEREGCCMSLHLECAQTGESASDAELEQLLRSIWQLALACEIRISCTLTEDILIQKEEREKILAFGRSLYQWKSKTGARPEPIQIVCPVVLRQCSELYFPLETKVTIRREGSCSLPIEALCVSTVIPPRIPSEKEQGLRLFATNLERAVSGIKLARQGDSSQELYVVRTGPGTMIPPVTIRPFTDRYGCGERAPVFYALRPLSNQTVNRLVQLPVFDQEWKVIPDQWEEVRFQDIDLDRLADEFLEDLECCLEENFAEFLASFAMQDINILMEAKEILADAISKMLVPLSNEVLGKRLDMAREILKNRLRKNLVQGNEVSSVMEYEALAEPCEVRLVFELFMQGTKKEDLILQAGKLDLRNPGVMIFASFQQPYRTGALMDVTASIQDVEYHIRQSENGYESSEWFRLVIPITEGGKDGLLSADFTSDLLIPNPLRRVPNALILKEQFCNFTGCDAKNLEDDKPKECSSFTRWEHQINMAAEAVEQDVHEITITYQENSLRTAKANSQDLADFLCAYSQIREKLVYGIQKEHDPNAFAYFAMFAKALAACWKPLNSFETKRKNALKELHCNVCYNDKDKQMEFLHQDPGWKVSMVTDTSPSQVKNGELLELHLNVEGLSLYTQNTARVCAISRRNQRLFVFTKQQEMKIPSVAPEFIYQKKSKELPPIYAQIRNSDRLLAGTIEGKTGLEEIEKVLDFIWDKFEFSNISNRADVMLWYQYKLPGAGDGTEIRIPILLLPGFCPTEDDTKLKLKTLILDWANHRKPIQKNFSLVFEITVYAEDGQRTLLSLDQVEIRYSESL